MVTGFFSLEQIPSNLFQITTTHLRHERGLESVSVNEHERDTL